jgi:hypothetical protein
MIVENKNYKLIQNPIACESSGIFVLIMLIYLVDSEICCKFVV